MKPQKVLKSSFSTIMVVFLILAPLNSSEMVTIKKNQSFNTHLLVDAEGSSKEKTHTDLNNQPGNQRSQTQGKADHVNHDKKHADEDKHHNHVYTYDWIKNKKKFVVNILRQFAKIFVAVSYFAVLLCGYMSILH